MSAAQTFDRGAVEAAIEYLISLLDGVDGDADLEDDDPAGDSLDRGEEENWRGVLLPIWGVDQSLGPLNEMDARRAHARAQLMAA